MKLLLYFVNLGCLLGLSLADFAPLSDEQIDYINSVQSSWRAGRNFEPSQYDFVRRRLGSDVDQSILYDQQHPTLIKTGATVENLPESFDAREQWPDCDTIKEVVEQGDCGSCWAVSAAAVMSDRICVATGINVRLSAQDILTCCWGRDCGYGCSGGLTRGAFDWYVSDGVVTGGPYESYSGCKPYLYPDNARTIRGDDRPSEECIYACIDEYDLTYFEDKHFGVEAFRVKGVEAIMDEIYNNGPVTAGFDMYSDFYSYRSGVYTHVNGRYEGGHAVRIIGWGVENGQDYWLAINSWNYGWGEDGLVKIAKGINECRIEEIVYTGSVAV